MKTKDTIWNMSAISTITLIILMLIYLTMTLWSSNQLAGHMEAVTAHPFEVVISAGDLQTYVSEMRIRTERLLMYRSEEDVRIVRESLDTIYSSLDEPVEKIKKLYLGRAQDVTDLEEMLGRLRAEADACLEFAACEDNSLGEVERFSAVRLSPLYDQTLGLLEDIIQSAQTKKVEYGIMAESLRRNNLIGSMILMGLMIGVLLCSQHLAYRQRKELLLRSRLFDSLSANIDDAFLIRNARTEEIYYSALNMERVLGYPVKELDDAYQGFQQEEVTDIRRTVRSGKFISPLSRTMEYLRPNGEKGWMTLRIYRAADIGSQLVISVFSDCTDEIKSNQVLEDALLNAERANKAKSEFLSRMSHEIRTPLNAVIGMTTIAAASVNTPAKVENCLSKISFSSKHLLMLINDVLDMSKIESAKMSLQEESFDLSQVLNSFTATTYAQAKAKGVEFTEVMEGFEGRTQYIGDSLRVSQILLNLGSNAVKFTPSGGKVSLTVAKLAVRGAADMLRFIVRDNGIGMDEEALERIYKPFEQADPTIASRYGGTGLGMSITKNLVTLMSGRIEIQSKPGKGTSCIVDLPMRRDEEAREQPDFETLGLKAMVVDDELAACVEVTALLAKIKIQSQWVRSGAEAVERVIEAYRADKGFDLCLVDYKMPDMDGVEVTRRIRAGAGDDFPIIMISAYDCSEIEEEARAAGADAFLPKPLYRSSVYEAIRRALGYRREAVLPKGREYLSGRRILVAEDNELNREILMELLTMNGMEAECVCQGQEALRVFLDAAPGHFDAILMDIQMPVMNGYEATRHIRASGHPEAADIPIIATTANAFSDDISAALAAGMNSHVSKPIDIEQLCQVLADAISRR